MGPVAAKTERACTWWAAGNTRKSRKAGQSRRKPARFMSKVESREHVALAVAAAEAKKAENIAILELDKSSSGFTDYFVICTGSNPRQLQAISDEVDQKLSSIGQQPRHVEGYNQAEWILLDYVDFVVHIFSENARKF